MSYLLCHECYTWIESLDEKCPHCRTVIDAFEPDPSIEELRAVIGKVIRQLGEIRVSRPSLSKRGTLYHTSNGLFFVPHPTRLIQTDMQANSPTHQGVRTPFSGPHYSTSDPLAQRERHLPELLMSDPSAFFVPGRSIAHLNRLWNRWTIYRMQGSSIKLKPECYVSEFHKLLADLSRSMWHEMAFDS